MHTLDRFLIAAMILLTIGRASRATDEPDRASHIVRTPPLLRVVPYKQVGDVTLRMHVVGPADGESRPAVVLFFCGGWRGFDAEKYFPQSAYFASRGVLCFNAEVRTIARHGTTPAECVIDAKSAIRWVRSHAREYGVDPERIAACGGSAAGHVSAATATVPGFDDPNDDREVSPKPDALLLFCPALAIDSHPRRVRLMGGEEQARALSPVRHVDQETPPTLIMVGENDRTTPPAESRAFAEAMKKAGRRCEVEIHARAGHGFHNWFDGRGRHFVPTLRQIDAFLADLGWLEGGDTLDDFEYVRPRIAAARK